MKLHVDPTSCRAHGPCMEQARDLIELDEWGCASVRSPDVSAGREGVGHEALAICPNLALRPEASK